MANKINYPELKAYLLKLYNLFEFVYDNYFQRLALTLRIATSALSLFRAGRRVLSAKLGGCKEQTDGRG